MDPVRWDRLTQNNNNEYLESLTHTCPKRLHILYKHILSKFNAYNMNAHTHARTHTDSHTHTHTHTHQSHIRATRAMRLKKKVFKKRKVFKEDLKELTEVEWRTETGSWFQINGAW